MINVLNFRFNSLNNLTCLTSRKRQSSARDNRIRIRGERWSGGLENGDRHEVRFECNNNNDGRGAILQGYKARSIVNPIKHNIDININSNILINLLYNFVWY